MPKKIIKVNLIAGFLGSGKTTLIRHFLKTSGERVAVLLNEIGEVSLDAKTLRAAKSRASEMANGCICCQVSNDFVVALKTLCRSAPDRVLIESTGIAEPARILRTLREAPSLRHSFSVEPSVVVVDTAGFFSLFQTLAYFYVLQLRAADIVVLNKTDVATRNQIVEAEKEIRKLNPKALVVRARRGNVDLHGILEGASGTRSAGFESLRIRMPGVLDPAGLRSFMENLPREIYRAKGRVRLPSGRHEVQYLTGSYEREPLKGGRNGSDNELLFIGSRIDERRIAGSLQRCVLAGGAYGA